MDGAEFVTKKRAEERRDIAIPGRFLLGESGKYKHIYTSASLDAEAFAIEIHLRVADRSKLKEATRVTSTEHWGWCSDNCYYRLRSHPTPTHLQVANVNILGSSDCASACHKIP